jgi:hypothetical protein
VLAAMANMELLDEYSGSMLACHAAKKYAKMSKFSSTNMAPT